MHPINKALYQLGLMLQRTRPRTLIPLSFHRAYLDGLRALKRNSNGFRIYLEERYEVGSHPDSFIDQECSFASFHLQRTAARRILDVGSYRHFILGLLAHSRVTTVDVRARNPIHANEDVITCDAKHLALHDASVDAVVSLCALEHFGLGRYGDDFDPEADAAAFAEMVRVLAPGGRIIFSTTLTRGQPQIVYNAHRIYTLPLLHDFCRGLVLEEEKYYVHRLGGFAPHEEVSATAEVWDVYLGCWRKD